MRSNKSGNQNIFCDRAVFPLACAVHCDLAGSPETLAVVGAAGGIPRPCHQYNHGHRDQHDLVCVSHHNTGVILTPRHCLFPHWCPPTELGSHPTALVPTVPAPAPALTSDHWTHESLLTSGGLDWIRMGQITNKLGKVGNLFVIYFQHPRVKFTLFFGAIHDIWNQGKVVLWYSN